ncbi:AI-2E family transporter [Epibacterium sp. SM1979]|uniref:AI-2E family transporter n=1 Tax=Tritonibacter litoralis TaxID=2662264 RepID=A0A843YEC8_9RHOB|nr:AI-2E family transporter [Tritonibacter litoralis]MQQ07662.1 AI-2E family transporter [Tritonibacter litoralis]
MALPAKKQFQYWGIAALVFAVVMWALGHVLLPFILGAAIAYLIDPVADRLEAWGMSRTGATAAITIGAVVVFLVMLIIVLPSLIGQMIDLVRVLPEALGHLRGFAQEHFPQIFDQDSRMHQLVLTVTNSLRDKSVVILETALGSAVSLLNVLILLVIVPVVAVYLLLDWDRMIERIDALLPRDHAPIIRQLAGDIDAVLASFIRGMGTVCLILGTYYAVALMAVGLNFGLAVGFVAGLVTFIPYLGSLIGGALAIGLAIFQYWGAIEVVNGDTVTYATDWMRIGVVAAIFIAGQIVEGNYLTPKLVGSSVGLHPVWLLLALSVFGALFGFVGMLVAVPFAAALGVLARFLIDQYLDSRLYRGIALRRDDDEDAA